MLDKVNKKPNIVFNKGRTESLDSHALLKSVIRKKSISGCQSTVQECLKICGLAPEKECVAWIF